VNMQRCCCKDAELAQGCCISHRRTSSQHYSPLSQLSTQQLTSASGEALRFPAVPATAVATSGDCRASPSAFLFLLLSACAASPASSSGLPTALEAVAVPEPLAASEVRVSDSAGLAAGRALAGPMTSSDAANESDSSADPEGGG